MPEQPILRRVQVREILHRHHGSVKDVAQRLGLTHASVGMWLGGRSKSKRVAAAATAKALELLELERSQEKSHEQELQRTA